ncbi:MAG: Rho termination factor [Flavobacterium sp.]|nr:MAG: Rho termination factor [Flavobacterium sp.]
MPADKKPGPQVKNEDQYEALRDKGYSKEKSARISNSKGAEKRGGKAEKYEDRTKADLYEEAKKVGIEGRSKMTKAELAKALRNN